MATGPARAGNGSYLFGTARFNSNGTLDTSFGSGGLVTTNISGFNDDMATAVAIGATGKITVVGSNTLDSGGYYVFTAVRYNADGSPDTSFSGVSGLNSGVA